MLSKMAIDIFSIPPMSAEPERVLSSAKHTISSETLELLECMNSWSRLGIFTEADLHAVVGTLEEKAVEASD